MVTVTTRSEKGSELSWAELDANFTDIAAAINLIVPTALAYGTSIPFSGNKYMPQQNIAGAVAFSADATNAIEGGITTIDIIANGTNIPTFNSPLIEWDGSSGYVNTNGVRNCITFFRRSDKFYYSINQAMGLPVEPVAATAYSVSGPTSGVTGVVSTNFIVSANGSLASDVIVTIGITGGGSTTPSPSVTLSAGSSPSATFTYTPASTGSKTLAFTNNGGLSNPANKSYESIASATVPDAPTALSSSSISSSSVSLTWSAPSNNGGAAITDYVVQFKLTSGGSFATFSDGTNSSTGAVVTGLTASTSYDFRVAAVNSVGQGAYSSTYTVSTGVAGATPLRMLNLTGFTESGDGTAGWNYTGTATYTTMKSVGERHLASEADGYIELTIGYVPSGGSKQIWLGCGTNSAAQIYSGMFEALNAADTYTLIIGPGTFAGYGSPYTGVSVTTGDVIRLRRAGSSLFHEVSHDSGETWDTYRTSTVSTADLYFYISGDGAGIASNVRGFGLI